TLDGKCAL
ncbi:hypothetical protein D030_1443B, partial [Vibrio parahaemolyticus AQ3810]